MHLLKKVSQSEKKKKTICASLMLVYCNIEFGLFHFLCDQKKSVQ